MHLGVNTLFHVPGDVGGTETYLRELLLAMVADYRETPITLFTQNDNHGLMNEIYGPFPNVSCVRIPIKAAIRPLRILAEQTLLPMAVMRRRISLLWSPGYTAPFWAGCPQVVTIHDLQYKSYPEDLPWLERITLDCLVRLACRTCRKIITVSGFSRSEIIEHGFAQGDKIHAVLEGVDPSFSWLEPPDRLNERLQGIIPCDRPYILCVAHSYPHKNLHVLIDAFSRIRHRLPHNLVLVGKPRLGEERLQESIRHLGKSSRFFRLQDGVPYDTLKRLYQGADMFVLPSTYEGFGLPVLEAMMAGVPVIISKKAALPEVGGPHARYVEPLTAETLAETMLQCGQIPDDDRRFRSGLAREWAQGFTWEKCARETRAVFDQVLSET